MWNGKCLFPYFMTGRQSNLFSKANAVFISPLPSYPTLWSVVFLSVLHPGEDFFFFFIISSQQLGGNKGTQLFSEP